MWNVSGCSGGAIVVPSEEEEGGSTMPTLVICGGATATPVDRTGDPQLAQWAQVDLTSEGYFPPEIPGKWNCSAAREVGPLGQCCNVALRQRGHAAMRRFTSGASRSGAMLYCDATPAGQCCNVTLRAAGELIFFGSSPVAPATSAATAAATSAAVAATPPPYETSRIFWPGTSKAPLRSLTAAMRCLTAAITHFRP